LPQESGLQVAISLANIDAYPFSNALRPPLAMLDDLKGKRAIVTGAGAGIGLAISKRLVEAGVRVALADIDEASAMLAADGLGAVAVTIDVRRRKSVEVGFSKAIQALGGLDILCANAGVSTMNSVVDLTDEEWDFNFDVNARGVFLTNQHAVRHFLETKTRGTIINTASLAAKVGSPLLAHYSASKFAVVGFTQALAREVAASGIRVNCVCPGLVKTGMQLREIEWEARLRGIIPKAVYDEYIAMTPLGRIEEPDDVAKTVVFLASDMAGFITGEALNVTGGVRMD
jgi:NAD(P)-dependent dehydrogenase (short-subunit alcohol dehydrogenase family)